MLMYIHIFKYVPILSLIGVFIVPASTYLTLDRNEINYDSINQKVRDLVIEIEALNANRRQITLGYNRKGHPRVFS